MKPTQWNWTGKAWALKARLMLAVGYYPKGTTLKQFIKEELKCR